MDIDFRNLPKALQPFYWFGVEFNNKSGNQHIGTCLFCNKENHFFVNIDSGAWDCKRCGKSGGIISFLKFFYEKIKQNSTDEYLKILSTKRGLPIRLLKQFGIVSDDGINFYLPIYVENNDLTDVNKLNLQDKKPKFKITPTRFQTIFNLQDLVNKERSQENIYITEGTFDAIALYWLFEKLKHRAIVIGLPGANTFKGDWTQYFLKRNVKTCLDNDDAGDNGTDKIKEILESVASSIKYLNWPREYKSGYDISDFVREWALNKKDFKGAFDKLQLLIKTHPRNAPETHLPAPSNSSNISLASVLEEFKQVVEWNYDLETLTKVYLATILSVRSPGTKNPVWLFVVGPPGFGKTTILMSGQKSAYTYPLSNLSSAGLISGWNKSKNDPSILAKVNNKCLILKDYTEIINKNEIEKRQILSILWGAFDGEASRDYGQGTIRRIKSKFSFIAGVTRKLYGEDQTAIGERFLRFNMRTEGINFDKQQETAMLNDIYGDSKSEKLSLAVAEYLGQNFDFAPERIESLVPQWFRERIRPLARLLVHIRTPVERHPRYSRMADVPICDPISESGNRLGIQLQKLAWSLAIIEKKDVIDLDIYSIIKRVAIDTIYGNTFKIMQELIRKRKGLTVEELSSSIRVQTFGTKNYLDDMIALNLLDREKNGKGFNYYVKPEIKALWKESVL